MLIGQIVLKLRNADTSFGDLIGGAAQLALALSSTLTREMAFVIPLADNATDNKLDMGIDQKITESFGVVVALKNDISASNKLGLIAYDRLHSIRAEIWKAILGWLPTGYEDPISYGNGKLLDINPAYLWYQFKFNYKIRIDNDDGISMGSTDSFDTLYNQWVLSPNVEIPIKEYLPVTGFTPSMESSIDLTIDPNGGAFDKAFNVIFDVYTG